MTPLLQWAARHAIPHAALADLLHVLGTAAPADVPPAAGVQSEAAVQQAVRLEVARRGGRVFRNNSGVAYDERGVPVRFGVGNESAEVNAVMKSSDLIGITPVTCPCGHRYGVFTAYEIKRQEWKFRQSDKRAVAQLNFIKLVTALGGIAKFVTNVEDL